MENKTLSESSDRRFALLIDADNVSARYLKPILNELSKYGTVTIKRIYGDWTLTLHAKWKDALLENSITPIQQFGYTQGKNATDSAMIIDAMDILYTDNVDGFCLVSSDSDFDVRNYGTNLLSKLLEEFTRVRITKDHSSVSVELAEDEEPAGSSAERPEAAEESPARSERKTRGRRGGRGDKADKPAEAPADQAAEGEGPAREQEAVPEVVEEVVVEETVTEPAAEEAPARRVRNHRGTRRVAAKTPARLTEGEQAPVAGLLKEPAAEAEPAVEEASEVLAPAAESAPAPEEPKDVKPGRKARAQRKAAQAEPAPEAPKEKPAKQVAKKQAAKEPEPKAEAKEKAPAKKAAAPKKRATKKAAAPAVDTPAGYIHQLVVDAGQEGVLLSTITDSVRAKFKDFKVRDLGYAQMRQYMASTGQYQLEKSGRNFRVRLS